MVPFFYIYQIYPDVRVTRLFNESRNFCAKNKLTLKKERKKERKQTCLERMMQTDRLLDLTVHQHFLIIMIKRKTFVGRPQ